MEADNLFLAVAELHINYKVSAKYDDELTLVTALSEATRVKLKHSYTLLRGNQTIATETTVLARVNVIGNVKEIPPSILSYL